MGLSEAAGANLAVQGLLKPQSIYQAVNPASMVFKYIVSLLLISHPLS